MKRLTLLAAAMILSIGAFAQIETLRKMVIRCKKSEQYRGCCAFKGNYSGRMAHLFYEC